MSAGTERSITTGLGPLRAIPSVTSSTTLDTTPVKITASTDSSAVGVRRARIVNGSSSANLAYVLVARGASAPSFTAAFASTSGSIILPLNTEFVNFNSLFDLYVCASASGTSYQVTIVDE